MTKRLTAMTAAAAIVAALTLAPTDVHARKRGAAVAAGIIGGIAAGAIVGSIIANSQYGPPPPVHRHRRYRPRRAYGPGPAYGPVRGYAPVADYAPPPVPCPGGYWARRPIFDRYGDFVRYSRPRLFCP